LERYGQFVAEGMIAALLPQRIDQTGHSAL
jgi:hypothetical protein